LDLIATQGAQNVRPSHPPTWYIQTHLFLIKAAASNEAMSDLSAGGALARGENEAE